MPYWGRGRRARALRKVIMKKCPDCGLKKPTNAFHRNIRAPGGRHVYCKKCNRVRMRAYRISHRHELSERGKLRRAKNPERTWVHHIKQKHGSRAIVWYEIAYKEQGGICAICGLPERVKNKKLSLDHCHHSGRLRGLLCNRCNTGLGSFKDSPLLLRKALKYLKRGLDTRSRKS